MVEVPHLEEMLRQWTASSSQRLPAQHSCVYDDLGDMSGEEMKIGGDCGLFVQELRSQFTSAIVFTSQKLMHTLSAGCHVDITSILFQISEIYPEGPFPSKTGPKS